MPLKQTRWPFFVVLVVGVSAVALLWYFVLSNPKGEAEPASGGHYVEGVTRAPDHINPLFAGANQTDRDLASLIFSGLIRLSPDGTPQPDLAERWEITGNGQSYVFHLRRGVAWQDGGPFTADDVVFTFRAIADPAFKGDPALAQLMQGVVVTARDPLTVDFKLEQAYAPFLSYLTVGILPRHLLHELNANQLYNAEFNAHPIGTGPYAFKSRSDTSVTLESNPTYYLGPPKISTLEFRIFPDENALVAAARQHEVDGALLDSNTSQAEIDVLRVSGGFALHPLVETALNVVYVDTRSPLFSDQAIRIALWRSLDVQSMIRDIGGGRGMQSAAGISRTSWAYSKVDVPSFDPGEAANILERAGWSRGSDGIRRKGDLRLAFTLSTANDAERVALADEIAREWSAIGADVTVQPLDSATYIDSYLLQRKFQAALAIIDPGPDPDPYPFWHSSQITPPGRDLSNYADPRIDNVLERARQTTDSERRKDLYALFHGYFIADAPAIPLFAPESVYAQSARVQGFAETLLFAPASRFSSVNQWYINTRVQ